MYLKKRTNKETMLNVDINIIKNADKYLAALLIVFLELNSLTKRIRTYYKTI
jgi:hypothetical protein